MKTKSVNKTSTLLLLEIFDIKANLRCQFSHYKMASPLICGVCFEEYKDFKTLEKHLYVCQKNANKSKLVPDHEITETEQIKNNVQGKTFLQILRCFTSYQIVVFIVVFKLSFQYIDLFILICFKNFLCVKYTYIETTINR